MVILGTGVQPNTEVVAKAVSLEKDGSINADKYLQTSNQDIFAAGDCVAFPYWYHGKKIKIEHYGEAIQQGQIAAYNMLGKKVEHTQVPFFWTRQYTNSLHFVGNALGYDNVWVDNTSTDPKEPKFMAYYAQGDKILAVASIGRSPDSMVISEAMQTNSCPPLSDFKSGKVTIADLKKNLAAQKGKSKCKRADCCKNKKTENK